MLLKPICAENPCAMTTDKKPAEDNPAAGKPKKHINQSLALRWTIVMSAARPSNPAENIRYEH